jgi:hypothetical protein
MYSGLSGGLISYLSVNGFDSYFISVVFKPYYSIE